MTDITHVNVEPLGPTTAASPPLPPAPPAGGGTAPPASPTPPAGGGTTPPAGGAPTATARSSVRRKLTDLTPAEIRKIAADYGLAVTGVVGTTFGRLVSTLVYAWLVLIVSSGATYLIAALTWITHPGNYAMLTLALWLIIMASTHWMYLVNVPKLTGLIVTSQLGRKRLHVFGTGFGFKYLWERYAMEDFIDIQADVVSEATRFVTKEGAGITFPWSMQFTPFLALLPIYVRTENRAISEGLSEVLETSFSSSVLNVKTKDIGHPEVLDLIRTNLLRVLEGDPVLDMKGNETTTVELRDSLGYPIEERFAIMVELATLGAPKYDKDLQELYMGSLKVDHMRRDAKKLAAPSKDGKKWTGMPAERAMRQVMLLNNEPGVTDESFTIDLTDRATSAAGNAAHILKTGAVVAAGLGSNRKRSRRPGGGTPTAPAPTPGGN